MLTPKITKCKECAEIVPLIDEINCKISEMSLRLYNNIVFALNLHISYVDMLDLLNYKRILEYKLINSNYACDYSVTMIASKIKLITLGCKTKCPCSIGPTLTTTTTTCARYHYDITTFFCDCTVDGGGPSANMNQLTVGKYYYKTSISRKILVNSFLGCSEGIADNILDSTKKDTCAEVICSPTSTSSSSSSSSSTTSTTTIL